MSARKRREKTTPEAAKKAQECPAPSAPEPGEATKAAITHARANNRARRRRVQVKGSLTDGVLTIGPVHSDKAGFVEQMDNALGSSSSAFQNRLLHEVGTVIQTDRLEQDTNVALAVLDGVQPRDEVEAMLAAQMAATHSVAMHMLGKARRAEYLEHMNSFGGLATKLLRTFTAQTEALAKLRRGGEQTVRVEHVHVHSGGQAIVGAVNARGGGGLSGNRSQPHAPIDPQALAVAPGTPLWGEDPARELVPVASSEG